MSKIYVAEKMSNGMSKRLIIEKKSYAMLKRLLSTILLLGIIPCDAALFTLYSNADLGNTIVIFINAVVCGVAFCCIVLNMSKQKRYKWVAEKYILLFFIMIIANWIGSVMAGEEAEVSTRTMSMICVGAYYLYSLYAFDDADTLIRSINATLLVMILIGFVFYFVDFDKVSYIERAELRYFKGVAKNRNSYTEISLLYIVSNMYLWNKNKKHSLYYICTTAIAVYTTYLTHSATGTVSMVILFALSLLYAYKGVLIPFRLFVIGYAVIFVMLIIMQSADVPFLELITDIFQKDIGMTGRTKIWEKSIKLITEYPVFGRGFDTYALYKEGVYENDPHNSILYILLTQGAVGLTILLGVFGRVISKAKNIIKSNQLAAYMYIFIIVWMIRGLTESIFSYTHYVFWLAFIVIEMVEVEATQKSVPLLEKKYEKQIQ